jgi:hypothetical protein
METKLSWVCAALLICLCSWCPAQHILVSRVNADLEKTKGRIIITYDLKYDDGRLRASGARKYEKFKVEVYYSQDKGRTFSTSPLTYVSGDVGGALTPGLNKRIYWHYFVENADFDGKNLVFKIRAEPDAQAEENRIMALGGPGRAFSSVLLPGLGDYQVRSGKHYWAVGALTLGTLLGGYLVGKGADRQYEQYTAATSSAAADEYFARAGKSARLSNGMIGAGVTVWLADVALVALKGAKNKRAKAAILPGKKAKDDTP